MKLVQCSACLQPKWLENKDYELNKSKFDVTTLAEFNKRYRCRKCRCKVRKSTLNTYIATTPEFQNLQKILQEEVTLAVQRDIRDPSTLKNFMHNVKNILDTHFIFKYSFDIVNGDLIGIVLNDIPFFKSIYMKLNSKGR